MSGSRHYLNFIASVWDFLSQEDRDRMGETWLGYEQVFGDVYQQMAEVSLNHVIQDMLPFTTERWQKYEFSSDNEVLIPAIFTSTQDLSVGVNLITRFLLRFSIDGGPQIEVDLRGVDPGSTTIDEIKDIINAAAGFEFAKGIFLNSILQFTSPTVGPTSNITWYPASVPANDAAEFVIGILPADLPLAFPEFPFKFSITNIQRVVDIPTMRTHVRDETLDEIGTGLVSGTDYAVSREENTIAFKVNPAEVLWAKRTLIDDETPFNNFGFLMDIFDTNSDQYVSILQGLWLAFWNGPKPINLRKALYLLFTLPTALEDTTVTAVSPTEITTTSPGGVIRTFEVPIGLEPEVVVGQEVEKFTPLVTGIDVLDKTSLPGFITTEIGRTNIQRFLTEDATRGVGPDTDETKALTMLEEHTFLPQISVDAFITPNINLGNVFTFLDTIQPLHKTFLFQVIIGEFKDELEIDDRIGMDIDMNVTPNVDSNQTTFADPPILDDYETIDNDDLNTDSDGLLFQEAVNVEVKSFGAPIDNFDA